MLYQLVRISSRGTYRYQMPAAGVEKQRPRFICSFIVGSLEKCGSWDHGSLILTLRKSPPSSQLLSSLLLGPTSRHTGSPLTYSHGFAGSYGPRETSYYLRRNHQRRRRLSADRSEPQESGNKRYRDWQKQQTNRLPCTFLLLH